MCIPTETDNVFLYIFLWPSFAVWTVLYRCVTLRFVFFSLLFIVHKALIKMYVYIFMTLNSIQFSNKITNLFGLMAVEFFSLSSVSGMGTMRTKIEKKHTKSEGSHPLQRNHLPTRCLEPYFQLVFSIILLLLAFFPSLVSNQLLLPLIFDKHSDAIFNDKTVTVKEIVRWLEYWMRCIAQLFNDFIIALFYACLGKIHLLFIDFYYFIAVIVCACVCKMTNVASDSTHKKTEWNLSWSEENWMNVVIYMQKRLIVIIARLLDAWNLLSALWTGIRRRSKTITANGNGKTIIFLLLIWSFQFRLFICFNIMVVHQKCDALNWSRSIFDACRCFFTVSTLWINDFTICAFIHTKSNLIFVSFFMFDRYLWLSSELREIRPLISMQMLWSGGGHTKFVSGVRVQKYFTIAIAMRTNVKACTAVATVRIYVALAPRIDVRIEFNRELFTSASITRVRTSDLSLSHSRCVCPSICSTLFLCVSIPYSYPLPFFYLFFIYIIIAKINIILIKCQ